MGRPSDPQSTRMNVGSVSNHPDRPDAGFSQVEIIISIVILVIAGIGTMQLSLATVGLESENRERAMATEVLREAVEEMRSTPFDELFWRYNANALDNPVDGVSPGRLRQIARRMDNAPPVNFNVQVDMPVNMAGNLSEETAMMAPGMTTDLDMNGVTTADADMTEYRVLPIQITISWTSATGDLRQFNVPILVSRASTEDRK